MESDNNGSCAVAVFNLAFAIGINAAAAACLWYLVPGLSYWRWFVVVLLFRFITSGFRSKSNA